MSGFLPAALPALVLLLFSAWLGTFQAAGAAATIAAHAVLLGVALLVAADWRDPLGLGRGRLLPVLLAGAAVLAWYQSPVARAGREGLTLLPLFLLLPNFAARCWRSPDRRRFGAWAVAAVVALVAGWSLVAWQLAATDGASLPLGHHNLLAAWLVALLPLAATAWLDGGAGRLLGGAGVVLGLGALAATRSLGGLLGLGAIVLLVAARRRRLAWLLALPLIAAAPRLLQMARGADTSLRARATYLEAGWRGFLERPFLGWGPGASRWTLAEHWTPVAGVNPPGEVVAGVHSLPLQLAYELGAVGLVLALAVAVVFVRRRRVEIAASADPRRPAAALLGLAGLAVTSLVGRPCDALALPVTAALLAGLALSGRPVVEERAPRPLILVAAVAVLLLPVDRAHLAYDRARRATTDAARIDALREAVAWDGDLPLYRLRLAVLEDDPGGIHRAAEDARGLAPFWLLARDRGALVRAWELDPLSAIAPYLLAVSGPPGPDDVWAARALEAEPRLRAAVALQPPTVRAQANRRLVLEMDADPATAVSLLAFRRSPWPLELAVIPIDVNLLE